MKKQNQLLHPMDSRKSLLSDSKRSYESKQTPYKSLIEQQTKERNLFTKISSKEQWISSLNQSLKATNNIKNHYAVLFKYKKINGTFNPKKIKLRSNSNQSLAQRWLSVNNTIRRRSCYCINCGIQSKKLDSLNKKCPISIIMNSIPRERKKKRNKEKRLTQQKSNSKPENTHTQTIDIHQKYTMTKYGVITLLPSYQIEKYLKNLKKYKFFKKVGSVDDIEVNYQTETQAPKKEHLEIISMSKLDFIRKRELENKKKLNRRRMLDTAKFSEVSETDSDSRQIMQKSIKQILSKKDLIMEMNSIDRQKSKVEVVLRNFLQRNRLTTNNTVSKFIDQKPTRSSNTTNDTGKYFSFLSLHQIHQTKQSIGSKHKKNLFLVKSNINNPSQQLKQSHFIDQIDGKIMQQKKNQFIYKIVSIEIILQANCRQNNFLNLLQVQWENCIIQVFKNLPKRQYKREQNILKRSLEFNYFISDQNNNLINIEKSKVCWSLIMSLGCLLGTLESLLNFFIQIRES